MSIASDQMLKQLIAKVSEMELRIKVLESRVAPPLPQIDSESAVLVRRGRPPKSDHVEGL